MLINELKKGVAYMQIKNKFFDSVKKVVENEMKIALLVEFFINQLIRIH